MSNTDLFRCKQFEPIFQAVMNSYISREFIKCWDMGAGGASGKSIFLANLIVFWLPEAIGDRALIYTKNSLHKEKTAAMMVDILHRHDYTNAKSVSTVSKTIKIIFGNDNVIEIESVDTSSKAALEDRFKTQQAMEAIYKFIWFEEFTGTLEVFEKIETFESNYARLLRQLKKDGLIFFSYNPSRNMKITSLLRSWRSAFKYKHLPSTIYGLPKKWQDEQTLEFFEKMRKDEKKHQTWRHLAMGEDVGASGEAFDFDESIWTELSDDYVDFWIQTDEATRNATVFALYGWTAEGGLHLITNYYHSSKVTGNLMSSYQYRKKFRQWYTSLGITVTNIGTDSLEFAVTLQEEAADEKPILPEFKKASSVISLKNRPRQYKLFEALVIDGLFKIVNRPENTIMYEQMKNAELDFDTKNRPVVSKEGESTDDNTIHTHILDTAMYVCLRNQKRILRGRKLLDG